MFFGSMSRSMFLHLHKIALIKVFIYTFNIKIVNKWNNNNL